MKNCCNCNNKLTKDDLEALGIVEIKKYYCQDCLLKVCKNLFVDNEGILNDTWNKYEKFLINCLSRSIQENDLSYLDEYIYDSK